MARNHRSPWHRRQTKEVFEMAASLSIEEESGTYTARFRHPHNGYYAGDFSQISRSGSELRDFDPGHLAGVSNPDRVHARHQ